MFYYSGHSDETGLLLGGVSVDYKRLRGLIDKVPADVRIGILDSCSSGAFTRSKGGKKREPFLAGAAAEVEGHAFLTSSSADEAAQESDRIGGSFFTHFLVTGLRGAADTDGDRRVTLGEAYRFAFDETLERTETSSGGPQHAAYDISLAGTGDLVMTDLRKTSAKLEIAADVHGRIYVRDRRGDLAAELHKPKNSGVVTLALEPGDYAVTIDDGHNLHRADVAVRSNKSELLAVAQLADIPLEGTRLRGGRARAQARRSTTTSARRLSTRSVQHRRRSGCGAEHRVSRQDPQQHLALARAVRATRRCRAFSSRSEPCGRRTTSTAFRPRSGLQSRVGRSTAFSRRWSASPVIVSSVCRLASVSRMPSR